MVYELHVDNVKYCVGPQEVSDVLQSLQLADGLLDVRCDRAEGWKEAFENMIRKWGPAFLLKLVLTYDSLEKAKMCAHALHGRWIRGLSKEGLKATTYGDPEAPQTSGVYTSSAQCSGGCRPPLPIYPDFVRVSTSPLTPFMSAQLAKNPALRFIPSGQDPLMCSSSSTSSLGLSSVPTRPSLRCNPYVQDMLGSRPPVLGSEAASSSSQARARSRSPHTLQPRSIAQVSRSFRRSPTLDSTSDEELRAGLLQFLQDD
eukprot:s830_g26.t1